MQKLKFILFVFLIGALAPVYGSMAQVADSPPPASAPVKSSIASQSADLTTLINQKSAELQQLQAERQRLEQNLQTVAASKNTLKRDLDITNFGINQLNLSIQANKVALDELNLQQVQLASDIQDSQKQIQHEKDSVVQLFIELQQTDHENLLVNLLKSKSLSQGMSEVHLTATLNKSLVDRINNLKNLQVELGNKITESKQKKLESESEQVNLVNRQYILQDEKTQKQKLLDQTQNQEKTYQQQLSDLIDRQIAISEEVEKIEAQLREKIDPNLLPIPRPGVLAMPVTGVITQGYGYTKFAKNGYQGHFHNGVDIGAPVGTPVYAPENGVVAATGNQDAYCPRAAYGRFIVIKHGDNLTTLYGHLSRIVVKLGDIVEKGDLIGYVGRTGYATGPHLHFTVFASPTFYMGGSRSCGPMPFGGDLDPTKYLPL